jgi:hypothetical protein
MSKCITWKHCVKNAIKTFKKQNPHKKVDLKSILKKAKVDYAKTKGKRHSSATKKRSATKRRRTRRSRK